MINHVPHIAPSGAKNPPTSNPVANGGASIAMSGVRRAIQRCWIVHSRIPIEALIRLVGTDVWPSCDERPKQPNDAQPNKAGHYCRCQYDAQRPVGRYLLVTQHVHCDSKPPCHGEQDANSCEWSWEHFDPPSHGRRRSESRKHSRPSRHHCRQRDRTALGRIGFGTQTTTGRPGVIGQRTRARGSSIDAVAD